MTLGCFAFPNEVKTNFIYFEYERLWDCEIGGGTYKFGYEECVLKNLFSLQNWVYLSVWGHAINLLLSLEAAQNQKVVLNNPSKKLAALLQFYTC